MDLVEHFKEFDPKHPDKPLGVRPFNPSKVDKEYHPDHWILYCLHDPDYLAYKHESRSYHYTLDQIEAFDRDLLEDNYYHYLSILTYLEGQRDHDEDAYKA